jgi:hypothetical protein
MADDIDTVVTSRLMANPKIVARDDAYNGTGEISVMELNMRRWPFSDRRFRAAFLHAVDREFLVKAINFGQGKVAHGPLPSTAPYYDDKALTKYPYDPARARALLDEMGLKPKLGRVRHRSHHADAGRRRRHDPRRAIYQAGPCRGRAGRVPGSHRLADPRAAAATGNSTATPIPMASMAIPPSAHRASICPRISARACRSPICRAI